MSPELSHSASITDSIQNNVHLKPHIELFYKLYYPKHPTTYLSNKLGILSIKYVFLFEILDFTKKNNFMKMKIYFPKMRKKIH